MLESICRLSWWSFLKRTKIRIHVLCVANEWGRCYENEARARAVRHSPTAGRTTVTNFIWGLCPSIRSLLLLLCTVGTPISNTHACLWIEVGERRDGQVGVGPGAAGVHSSILIRLQFACISKTSIPLKSSVRSVTQLCQARVRELERLTSLASLQSEEAALELDGLRRRLSVSPLQWRSFLSSLQLQFALPAISSASSSTASSSYRASSGQSLTRPPLRPSARPSLKSATNNASSFASNSLQKNDIFEVQFEFT